MSKTYVGLVPGKEYYACNKCNRYHYTESQIGKAHLASSSEKRVRGQERAK